MTGYVRKDTTNNIADGNVINAADLDAEFDGVQAAFNASTGHKHDGTASEGATINALGPTQDVTISATLVAPKTTNFVDIGSSGLKFKDMFLAGNASIGGTLAVTGVATFTAQPILSSLTASRAVFSDGSKGLVSNAITGTGNVVMSASPTLTGTIGGASLTLSSLTSGRVTYAGTSGLLQDSANLTFNGTTLTANTLNLTNALGTTYGGTGLTSFTANGVVYASSSSVLATGSALTFDGTTLTNTASGSSAFAATGKSLVFYNASTSDALLRAADDTSTVTAYGFNKTDHKWYSSGSEQMRLTSTGLGIGTSSPAFKLDVSTSGTTTIRSISTANGDVGRVLVASKTSGAVDVVGTFASEGNGSDVAIGATSNHPLLFLTNNTERARINSSGQFGLGTTAPDSIFGIGNTQGGTRFFYDRASYANIFGGFNHLGDSGGFELYSINGSSDQSIRFSNGASYAGRTERMRLDSSGNLGIGTSSPGYKLDVSGTGSVVARISGSTNSSLILNAGSGFLNYIQYSSSVSGGLQFYDVTNAANRMLLDTSGNLGIGTTTPTQKLYVVGNGLFDAGFTYWTTTASTPGSTSPAIWSPTSGAMGFWANGAERMRLSDSGNFLIGGTTVNVNEKLGVYGNQNSSLNIRVRNTDAGSSASSAIALNAAGNTWGIECGSTAKNSNALTFQVDYGGANTERMRLDTSGNLGIGTTSPDAKLEVASGNAEAIRLSSNSYLSAGQGPWIGFDGGPTSTWNLARIQGTRAGTEYQGNLLFFTNNSASDATAAIERMRLDSSGKLTASYGGYIEPSITLGTNGFNIYSKDSWNDNLVHNSAGGIAQSSVTVFMVATSGGGITTFPLYSNGGDGIAFHFAYMNPGSAVWTYSTGVNITFSNVGSNVNTYNVQVTGGGGIVSIQRTAGTAPYTFYVQRYFSP